MNTFSRLSLSLFALMFFMVACHDSAPLEPNGNNSMGKRNGRITSLDYSLIQNPNNYQNIYGEIHNAGVDYIYQSAWDSVGDSLRPLTNSAGASLAVAFVNSISSSLIGSDLAKLQDVALATLDSLDGNATVGVAFSTLGLTPSQSSYCSQILVAINDSSIHDLSGMIFSLSTIETNVLNSTVLNSDEKRFPLALVAVAKHSAYYHAQHFDLSSSLVSSSGGAKHSIQKTSEEAHWKKVLEADAMGMIFGAAGGFLRGALTGAIGGLFTGGPVGGLAGAAGGALTGIAGGAAVGAVTGSGMKLIEINRAKED